MENKDTNKEELTPRNILDILLEKEPPEPEKAYVRHKRLSEHYGEEVLIPIKQFGYDKAQHLKKLTEADIHLVLAGIDDDFFKNDELLRKYGANTPADLVKDTRFLLPGELEELAQRIERHNGYRQITMETLKKK